MGLTTRTGCTPISGRRPGIPVGLPVGSRRCRRLPRRSDHAEGRVPGRDHWPPVADASISIVWPETPVTLAQVIWSANAWTLMAFCIEIE